MIKNVRKIFACCIIGVLAFSVKVSISRASEIPVAGIGIVLEEFYQNETSVESDIADYLLPIQSEYQDIAISKVTNYVNVRKEAKEDSTVLGKLYNDSAATVIETKDGWYQVKSGTVTGYVKAEYLVMGEAVEELAKTVGKRIALVTTETLKVREAASLDSIVQTLVPIGEEFRVIKEKDGWIEISIDSDVEGWVSSDYVELRTEFKEAESIEEEKVRLEVERLEAEQLEAERLEQVQSARNTQEMRTVNVTNDHKKAYSSKASVTKKAAISNTSSRSRIVNYALKFVGNPYVWGGTSLTNGADCSGFTQSVFRDKGIGIPRSSRTQAGSGRKVSLSNIQPGDLIFYDNNGRINHVGIYIGNGKVISASSPETGIRISNYKYRQPYKVVSYFD